MIDYLRNDAHPFGPLGHEIEASRARLLAAIAGVSDVTLVRSWGNVGDELIYAGTRQLLAGIAYREVDIQRLEGVTGDLAVVTGGGAWCKPFHAVPQYLSQIEAQFRQIVILPSSFDVAEESVRQTLARTKGLVFARERVSYEMIRPLCHAELAHDCAFFFDYRPYLRNGSGVLKAFRTDQEAGPRALPQHNNDVSVTCVSLDEWLWTIARHDEVHTDRAHVMIAAALLGKRVYYVPSVYHKVPAIADYALRSFSVESLLKEQGEIKALLMEQARANLSLLPEDFYQRHQQIEITVVMLSHGRLDQTLNAIRALRQHVRIPFRLLLIDNASGDIIQSKLREVADDDERIEFVELSKNLGCSGGREFAFKRVTTEYVLLLDNDIEVLPGTVEHLLYQLDLHRQAAAVTGKVVFPDGRVQLCGADFRVEGQIQFYELLGSGQRFDQEIGASGKCDWVPGCLALIRTDMLRRFPYDLEMRNYFEDNEWCHRINEAGAGEFCRSVEALGIHYHESKIPDSSQPEDERRKQTMKYVETLAHFYQKHGLIYEAMFHVVSELWPPTSRNIASAKIMLSLVGALGSEAVLEMWNRGDLAPLLAPPLDQHLAEQRRSIESLTQQLDEQRRFTNMVRSSLSWKVATRIWRVIKVFHRTGSVL